MPAEVFVGRDRELATFRAALGSVGRGKTVVFLVCGEPGIGKTRLAGEMGSIATGRGFQVQWGRCWEAGGAPAYWPWIEAVRGCLRTTDGSALSRRLSAQWAHLAVLVPEFRQFFPEVSEAEPTADPDRARFQLFDGMAAFLRAVAEVEPLMIVLDDLHAADDSSLMLLQFLARQPRDVPLVLVGCFRDTEVRASSGTATLLGDVARDAYNIALDGLDESDVGRFLDSMSPTSASPAMISTVRVVTGGNPFFVGEVVGQLAAGLGLDGRMPLPDGVREVVRSRVRRLPEPCVELLGIASVCGHEFTLPVLASTANGSRDRVAAILEEARGARLVALRSNAPGRYAFFHGLIREVLYEDLPANWRAEIHGRVGHVLERLYGQGDGAHVATLAHHFFMASTCGDADKAIGFCGRAAERALRQCAAPEAVEHYSRALQVLALSGGDCAQRRSAVLIGRGRALEHAGDFDSARADFAEAATIARQLGHADAFVDAALGCGEQWALKFTCSIIDKSDLSLLEEALRITAIDDGRRATLLARTGSALFFAGEHQRGLEVSATAVAMARELHDDGALARSLSARHAVLLGPLGLRDRFDVIAEIGRIGQVTGNREILLRSHVLRLYDLVERGDVDEASSEVLHIVRLVNDIGDPFERWHCTVSRAAAALFHGRIAESERLAHEAYNEAHRVPGQQRSDQNAAQCLLLQEIFVRREQARLDELGDRVSAAADRYPLVCGWRAIAALIDLDCGREHEAVARLDDLNARTLSSVAPDSVWSGTMFLLAELFTRIGDRARGENVFEILTPHAELNATIASPVWLGSSLRALAMLAGLLERWDEATALFERALDWHVQRGATLWLGHTQADYATVLLARRAAGDVPKAVRLLEGARRLAQDLDAARLAGRVDTLARECTASRSVPTGAAGAMDAPRRPTSAHAVFRREGEYWTVTYAGRTARLRHSRGMAMLACLLARPGHEIHATELVLVANPPPPAELQPALDDGVPRRAEIAERHLDPRARLAYRERLIELRGEIEEARSHHDSYRVSRAQTEVEQLAAELKRDLGLGGGRRSGTHAERARLNVTRAIRSALARIEDAHPALGEHFRFAVRTGTFCVYASDPASTTVWDA